MIVACFSSVLSCSGIGVVYVTLANQEGRNVIAQPCYPNLKYNHQTSHELLQTMHKILETKDFADLTDDDEKYCKRFLFFNWSFPSKLII